MIWRVFVIGSITRDRIEIEGLVSHCIGGVVWHGGTALAKLGIDTHVVTRLARSDNFFVDFLGRAGVQVVELPSAVTTAFVNRYSRTTVPDRLQQVEAVAAPIDAGYVEAALSQADLIYLGPLHPHDIASEVFDLFKSRPHGAVALDVQGYVRTIHGTSVFDEVSSAIHTYLKLCDYVKASREEAEAITGVANPREAALSLSRASSGGEAVVTCGSEGAYVSQGRTAEYVPAFPAEVVYATGAGDTFFAAYLAKRLDGVDLGAAAHFAADFTARRLADTSRLITLSG